MNTSRLKKYTQNQNNNLLLSYYNLTNLNKILKLKDLKLILRFNVETKNLKKISYEMFLSFLFLMFLYANQFPTFNRIKQRDNIYVSKFLVDVKRKNIYETLDKLILFILSGVRKENSFRFRKTKDNSINLYLRKLNIFLHIDKFPALQEFLKYETDILNFKVVFNFQNKITSNYNNLNTNFLRLLQIPINSNNTK